MAGVAVGAFVGAMQSERRGVLESRIGPARGYRLVAFPAITGESCPRMAGICRRREIGQVASLAINRRAGEFVTLLVDVASAAVGDGMNAD